MNQNPDPVLQMPQPDHTTPQPDHTTPQPDHTTPQPDHTTPQPKMPAQTELLSQEEQLRLENARCQRLFQKLAQEEADLHTANQKRIRTGRQCLIWIPMLFLILLFLTEREKAVFLLLWIVSLFITAGFLIYIEYTDDQSQKRLHRYTAAEKTPYSALTWEDIEAFEETVTELLHQIDERKTANRQRMLQILGRQPEKNSPERKESHHE